MGNIVMKVADQKSLDDAKTAVALGSANGNYVYKDYKTGVSVTPDELFDKVRDVIDPATAIYGNGGVRNSGDKAFDHLIVEFGNLDETNARLYANAMLETIANTDVIWTKDQKSPTQHTQGEKQTVYDLHQLPNGSWHMHVLVSNFAIKDNKAQPSSSFSRASYLEVVTKQINDKFQSLGLPEKVDGVKNRVDPLKETVTQYNKEIANKVSTGEVTPEEVFEKVQNITEYDQSHIGKYLQKIQSDIGKHMEEMSRLQVLANTLNQYQSLQQTLVAQSELSKKLQDELNIQVDANKEMSVKLTDAVNKKDAMSKEHNQIRDELELPYDVALPVAVAGKVKELQDDLEAESNAVTDLTKEKGLLETAKQQLEATNNVLVTDNNKLTGEKQQLEDNNRLLNETVNAKNETITALQEKNQSLTDDKNNLLEKVKGYIPKVQALNEIKNKFNVPEGENVADFIEKQMKALEEKLATSQKLNGDLTTAKTNLETELETSKNALLAEQNKTSALVTKLETQEKDFKEFIKGYFTEITSKLKNAGEVIAKLAKQISEPEVKINADKVAKEVKNLGSSMSIGKLDNALKQFQAKPTKPDDEKPEDKKDTKPKW